MPWRVEEGLDIMILIEEFERQYLGLSDDPVRAK